MRAQCFHRRTLPALLATISILFAAPALSSEFQDITVKTVDVVFVRPLAAARVFVGALMFVPAALFSLPMGQEGFDAAYDTLIDEPMEYAFRRKLGEM
jgi:hypothetical protein